MTGLATSPSKLFCNLSAPNVAILFMVHLCSSTQPFPENRCSSTQVVDASRGSVVRSHRRAMSCQISSIFSTRLVDPSRTSVVRSHSKVMHGPCRPPQQVSAYAPPPPAFRTDKQLTAPADRPIHAAAGTLAGSKGAAAGYDRIGPGSPHPNSPSQNRPPSSPVIHMRCSVDHRPASRCDAAPDAGLEQQEVRMTLKEP